MTNLVQKIQKADRKRNIKNIERRFLKLSEEVGEACQAYLGSTSKHNSKNKTWDDVREELSDVFIISTDILLTRMPNEVKLSKKDFDSRIKKYVELKLNKWSKTKKRKLRGKKKKRA